MSAPTPAPHISTARRSVAVVAPVGADADLVGSRVRRLLGDDVDWAVVVVLPPHHATTTGATGFAGPVLSAEEIERIAHGDARRGAALGEAITTALGLPADQAGAEAVHANETVALRTTLAERSIDLVVATPGHDSNSMVDELVDHAPCPVLVVPETTPPARTSPPTVLVAVDDSTLDEHLIRRSIAVFGSTDAGDGANLVIAHVEPASAALRTFPMFAGSGAIPPAMFVDDVTRQLHGDDHRAEAVARRAAAVTGLDDATTVGTAGPVVAGLLSLADEHGADVIAVGTHDRSWWSRLLRPSVSSAVEDRAERPVLMLRSELVGT